MAPTTQIITSLPSDIVVGPGYDYTPDQQKLITQLDEVCVLVQLKQLADLHSMHVRFCCRRQTVTESGRSVGCPGQIPFTDTCVLQSGISLTPRKD